MYRPGQLVSLSKRNQIMLLTVKQRSQRLWRVHFTAFKGQRGSQPAVCSKIQRHHLQVRGQRSRYQPSQLFHSSCVWVLPPRPPSPPQCALLQPAPLYLVQLVCSCDEPLLLVWVQVSVYPCPDPGTVTRWPPLRWGSGPDGQQADCPSCSTVFLSDTVKAQEESHHSRFINCKRQLPSNSCNGIKLDVSTIYFKKEWQIVPAASVLRRVCAMPGWDESSTFSRTPSTAVFKLHSSSGLSSVTVCKQWAGPT